MDNGLKKYTVLPKSCIDMWVYSIGVAKLPDDVGEVMVEDVTYRLREAVHNALKVMKHCKRTCLTVDDFNNALKERNTEPVYGHGGVDSLSFKSIIYKDGRICYLDEKELNLREIALDSVYPTDPGETTLKASWLVLEGHEFAFGKKDDCTTHLPPEATSYLYNISSALIDKSIHLRKVALENLAENKKLQSILPNLVTFLASQIKLRTGKQSFATAASYILHAIRALTNNASLLLTPYVFQLIKVLLFVITEAEIVASEWYVKDLAAIVLHQLCRRHTSIIANLHNQLLKPFQDSLNDPKRSLSSLYGTMVGIKTLGADAVYRVMYPVVKGKLKVLSTMQTSANTQEALQILSVRRIIAESISMMMKSSQLLLSSKDVKLGDIYEEMFEVLGEEFSLYCTRLNHCPPDIESKSCVALRHQCPQKPPNTITDMISKELKRLRAKKLAESKLQKDNNIIIITGLGNIVHRGLVKSKAKKSITKNVFVNMNIGNKRTAQRRQKHTKGTHVSLKRQSQQKISQSLTAISCYLHV